MNIIFFPREKREGYSLESGEILAIVNEIIIVIMYKKI